MSDQIRIDGKLGEDRPIFSDGHDQIMIEFCSISSLLDHLDHRGLSIRS